MAKLYEKQGEFTHALGVYHLLAKTDKLAKKKERELTKKFFERKNLGYDSLVLTIFNDEQLQKIKLMPHNEYKKLMLEECEQPIAEPAQAENSDTSQKVDTTKSEKDEKIDELSLNLDAGISLADFKKQVPQEEESEAIEVAEKKEVTQKEKSPLPDETTAKKSTDFEKMSVAQLLEKVGEHFDQNAKLTQITIGQLKKLLKL